MVTMRDESEDLDVVSKIRRGIESSKSTENSVLQPPASVFLLSEIDWPIKIVRLNCVFDRQLESLCSPNPYQPGSAHLMNTTYAFTSKVRLRLRSQATTLVSARLLGYMVIHAPSRSGRDNITQEITSCGDVGKLDDLAKYYIDHLLHCCEYLAYP
jgi:hypothetical protein